MKFCPHAHTGRKLEHHHTSYLGLAVLLVLVGFALGASTLSASAAVLEKSGSMQVSANVSGASPATAPTILQPSSGQTFSANPILVSGDCESGLTVEIRKNGYLAGTARCSNAGSYVLKIDLLIGSNTLIARQYNGAGYSPKSKSLTVLYRPNIPPIPTAQTQLILQSEVMMQAGGIGEDTSWTVQIVGGQGPYAVSWDWGDGTIDLKGLEIAGPLTLQHVYQKSGPHNIEIKASDKSGQTALLELSQFTEGNTIPKGSSGANSNPQKPGIIFALWPVYGLLIGLVWVFYIGERYGEKRERKLSHIAH